MFVIILYVAASVVILRSASNIEVERRSGIYPEWRRVGMIRKWWARPNSQRKPAHIPLRLSAILRGKHLCDRLFHFSINWISYSLTCHCTFRYHVHLFDRSLSTASQSFRWLFELLTRDEKHSVRQEKIDGYQKKKQHGPVLHLNPPNWDNLRSAFTRAMRIVPSYPANSCLNPWISTIKHLNLAQSRELQLSLRHEENFKSSIWKFPQGLPHWSRCSRAERSRSVFVLMVSSNASKAPFNSLSPSLRSQTRFTPYYTARCSPASRGQ